MLWTYSRNTCLACKTGFWLWTETADRMIRPSGVHSYSDRWLEALTTRGYNEAPCTWLNHNFLDSPSLASPPTGYCRHPHPRNKKSWVHFQDQIKTKHWVSVGEPKYRGLARLQNREGNGERGDEVHIPRSAKEKHNNPWQRWNQQEHMGGRLTEVGELWKQTDKRLGGEALRWRGQSFWSGVGRSNWEQPLTL